MPLISFDSPCKHQKTSDQWHEMVSWDQTIDVFDEKQQETLDTHANTIKFSDLFLWIEICYSGRKQVF